MEARGLVKRYGEREALRGVDFAADPGELVAIIGPNGAGKTTLLSILAGTVKPDGGEVSSPNGDVGWVPQQAALYRRLTVEENLLLFARLEKHEEPRAAVEEMLELTGLGERRGEIVARLSGGNQQRINIAIGLLARPVVLLLDEPSVGLDPRQRARLWEFVSGLAGRRHDGDLLHPRHPGGRALRAAAARPRRRREPLRRVRRRSCARRFAARPPRPPAATSRPPSSPSSSTGGTDSMRWLLLKDLQILRRSPLQAALLIAYPVLIALLIGFAISREPGKPRVAFLNEIPPGRGSPGATASCRPSGVNERICKQVECVDVAEPGAKPKRRSAKATCSRR